MLPWRVFRERIGMSEPLAKLLNRRVLGTLAGQRSFKRGETYLAEGRVGLVASRSGALIATVHGTRPYRVELWAEGGQLGYACTCPVGGEGAFCKHCVALGLAWLEWVRGAGRRGEATAPVVALEALEDYLRKQDKDVIINLFLNRATEDETLLERLTRWSALQREGGPDVATLRKSIERLVAVHDFVDHEMAWEYARRIGEASDSIGELVEQGHATEALNLAKLSLASVEENVDMVDDSDGYVGVALERLHAAYLSFRKEAKGGHRVTKGRKLDRRTRKMIEEAIVDAYDEAEQEVGFLTMMQDRLPCPLTALVVGEEVKVTGFDIGPGGRGIVAICRRKGRVYRTGVLALQWSEKRPKGSEWIEAYRTWLGDG